MSEDTSVIARLFRERRIAFRESQRDLARRAGTSCHAVWRVEHGCPSRRRTIEALRYALGIDRVVVGLHDCDAPTPEDLVRALRESLEALSYVRMGPRVRRLVAPHLSRALWILDDYEERRRESGLTRGGEQES